jgi:hypothetical protein
MPSPTALVIRVLIPFHFPQFSKWFDREMIFKPNLLIRDRNLHPLAKSVNRCFQEEVFTKNHKWGFNFQMPRRPLG